MARKPKQETMIEMPLPREHAALLHKLYRAGHDFKDDFGHLTTLAD
jgi:hypothetical protein